MNPWKVDDEAGKLNPAQERPEITRIICINRTIKVELQKIKTL